jgi:hypothetical protein
VFPNFIQLVVRHLPNAMSEFFGVVVFMPPLVELVPVHSSHYRRSAVDCTDRGPPAFDPARLIRPSKALRPLSGMELVEFRMTVDAAIWVLDADVSAPIRH